MSLFLGELQSIGAHVDMNEQELCSRQVQTRLITSRTNDYWLESNLAMQVQFLYSERSKSQCDHDYWKTEQPKKEA